MNIGISANMLLPSLQPRQRTLSKADMATLRKEYMLKDDAPVAVEFVSLDFVPLNGKN